MKTKFSLFTRFQLVILAIFSPARLTKAITAGFIAAVDSLDDEELRVLVKELNDAN